jgi:hypothetical protein
VEVLAATRRVLAECGHLRDDAVNSVCTNSMLRSRPIRLNAARS